MLIVQLIAAHHRDAGAKRSAADTLKRLGKAKCGPHDDFEWGMINGKFSAIRWMLEDDWDMLDT